MDVMAASMKKEPSISTSLARHLYGRHRSV